VPAVSPASPFDRTSLLRTSHDFTDLGRKKTASGGEPSRTYTLPNATVNEKLRGAPSPLLACGRGNAV